MKKFAAVSVASLMFVSCFVGCGDKEPSKFAGKWEASEMSFDGTTIDNYLGIPLNAMFQFDLKDNGKGEWHSPMSNSTTNSNSDITLSWKEKDENTIEVKAAIENDSESEQTFDLKYQDDKLLLEEQGVKFYLVKVDSFTEYSEDDLKNFLGGLDLSGLLGG